MSSIVNLTAYKFLTLPDPEAERQALASLCAELGLLGSVFLSPEGINFMVAGSRETVTVFQDFLEAHPHFSGMHFKESFSEASPFRRLKVKLKRELVPLGDPNCKPQERTGDYLPPQQLKAWLDEGRDFLLLDARNRFEFERGALASATVLPIDHFDEFRAALNTLPESAKKRPIVTYCTGGIRCEKATSYLLSQGFENVYQLEGGLLHYFSECGQAHYRGDCFVFDERIALTPALEALGLDPSISKGSEAQLTKPRQECTLKYMTGAASNCNKAVF